MQQKWQKLQTESLCKKKGEPMLEKKIQDIIDFVVFEEETSLYYPWKLNSKQISVRAERIAALLPEDYTTDDIYDAVSQVAGEKKEF